MDHEFKFGRFAGAIASPAGDAWRFAQDLLGKVVPSDFVLVEQQRTERAQWEWLADISTRHEGQRQKIVNSHVTAMADPEFVKWLAECTTLQEFDWDPAKHPRRGGPPNAGWFATTGGAGGTAGSGTSAGKVTGVFRGGKLDTNDEQHVLPRMLELAGAWSQTKDRLDQYRRDIERLPSRIASERIQLGSGGRYAYIHNQNLEKAQQDLETAKAQVPNLEAQLRELEIEYREYGFDEVPYGSWTPGETLISGSGIKEVGDVIKYGGSPAGLKPTGIEYDVALGAASLRQLGKAALTKTLTKAPPRSALKTRVAEVHRGLDRIAQSQRTTAVLETSDGTRIVASGGRDLTPGQKALLGPREIAAKSPGAHAELTALEQAAKHGLHPAKITASRPFCPECIEAIKSAGGKITSPTTAEFPR